MVEEEEFQKHPTMPEVVDELKNISDISIPIAAMSLMGYLKNMILVVSMGRLGSLELAGGALAVGFTNITGYSVLSGLATGMESITSQAFGSGNSSFALLTLQRTILMLLIASVPIGILWFNLEPLMLALNQDGDITRVAGIYCRYALPDLIANSLLHPLRIYLRSKGTTWPLMWSNLISIIFHLPLTIYLSFSVQLGIVGISISNSITNFITLIVLFLYIIYLNHSDSMHSKDSDTRIINQTADLTLQSSLLTHCKSPSPSPPLLSILARKEWRVLLGLSIPSCIAVCLEWWWYEFMTILAGYLSSPRVALASAAIVIQTTSLMYTLPAAISAAVSTRVGNELGRGRPRKAKLAAEVAIGLALFASLIGLILTTVGREKWIRVFTDDADVINLTRIVVPIIGLCELANCPQTTGCGILRGSARPGTAAGINLYSFYLVGAPLAVVLAFVAELGFLGLCYGLLGAQVACVVAMLTVVYRTDWEREWLKAKELVGKNGFACVEEDHSIVKCCDDGLQEVVYINV